MTCALIVDDNTENRYLLRVVLESHGWEVMEARHGAEALVKARLDPPSLLITDLLMPVMDGYTLLRHWKSDGRLRRIPFVVYTATYTEPEDEQLALHLGADAFLTKPSEPEPFFVRVRDILRKGVVEKGFGPREPVTDDAGLLTEYSEVLVRKLEKKAISLERANQALTAREAHLRAILDAEPECVKLLSEDGSLLEINPAGLRLLQAEFVEQVLNRRVQALVVENDRQAFSAFLNRVFAGESGAHEFHVNGLKGSELVVEMHASPFRDAKGTITALVAVSRDITELRRAESLLASTQENTMFAVRAGKIGLWDWDLRASEVTYSSEWKRQIGYEEHEITNSLDEWQSRIHPDDLDRALQTVRAFLGGGASDYESEFRLRHKDGSYRRMLARASEVRGADGGRARLVGSHVDITDVCRVEGRAAASQGE